MQTMSCTTFYQKKILKMKSVNVHILSALLITIGQAHAQDVWSLERCLDTAKTASPSVIMAGNARSMADLQWKEARANLIPKITVNADYRYFIDLPYQLMPMSVFGGPEGQFKETQFGVPHNIGANAQLTMPLYNPQVMGAMQTAETGREMARMHEVEAREQVLNETVTLYRTAQLIAKQMDLLEHRITNAKRLVGNVETLKEHSMVTSTDVRLVQHQLAKAETQLEALRLRHGHVIRSLMTVLGITQQEPIRIDSEPQMPAEAVGQKGMPASIAVANAQTLLGKAELKQLRMSRLPSLSLIGSYGTTGFGYDGSPDGFLRFYPLGFAGVQLSYPLFNGTVTSKRIAKKKLEVQNSELRTALLQSHNTLKLQKAEDDLSISMRSMDDARTQMAIAQDAYDLALLRQKEGSISIVDVIKADDAVQEGHQAYLTALAEHLAAELELRRLNGNLQN